MSSFVDLMANDVWSEADIVRRTEAMIRSSFSLEAETILNRKAMGAALGSYASTPEELAELDRYQAAVEAARLAGEAARADMALLAACFTVEAAHRLISELEQAEAPDDAAIAEAQAVIDAAPQAVTDLVAARIAPIEP